MKANADKWGRIINISSVHGVVASVNKSAYVASKHGTYSQLFELTIGLNGLTKVVALENAADTNITCNVICPGWVHTPLISKQIEVSLQLAFVSFSEPSRSEELESGASNC